MNLYLSYHKPPFLRKGRLMMNVFIKCCVFILLLFVYGTLYAGEVKFSAVEMCPECLKSSRAKAEDVSAKPVEPAGSRGIASNDRRSVRQRRRGRIVPIPRNIFKAIGRGDKATLDKIFSRFPAALNRRQKGQTPLEYAQSTNQPDMVDFLKQKEAVLSPPQKRSTPRRRSGAVKPASGVSPSRPRSAVGGAFAPAGGQTNVPACGSLEDCPREGGTQEELEGLLQTVNQLQMDEVPREEDSRLFSSILFHLHHSYQENNPSKMMSYLDIVVLDHTAFDRSLYHVLFEMMRFIKYHDRKDADFYRKLLEGLKNKKVGVQKNPLRDFLAHKLSGSLDKLTDNAYLLEFYEDMYGPAPNLRRRMLSQISRGMKSEDWRLRRQAIKAAGDMGGPEVVPLLEEALKEDQPYYVRMAGMKALGQMAGQTKLNRDQGKTRFERQVEFCTSFGPCDRDKLWTLINRELERKPDSPGRWCYHVGCDSNVEEGDMKAQALWAVGRMGGMNRLKGKGAYAVIQELLKHPDKLSSLPYRQKKNVRIAGLRAIAELGGLKAFEILKPYIMNYDSNRELADVAMEGMALIDHPRAREMVEWGKSRSGVRHLRHAALAVEFREELGHKHDYSEMRVRALTGHAKTLWTHDESEYYDMYRNWYTDWNNNLDEARLHVLMKAQKKGGQEAVKQTLNDLYAGYPEGSANVNLSQLGGREAFEEYVARHPERKTSRWGGKGINDIRFAYDMALRTPDEDILPVINKWLSEDEEISIPFREVVFQKLRKGSQTDQLESFLHKGRQHSNPDVRKHSTFSLMRLGGAAGQSLSRQFLRDVKVDTFNEPSQRFLLAMRNVTTSAESPGDLKLLQDGYVNILSRPTSRSQNAETGFSVLTAIANASPQRMDSFIDELSQHNNFRVRGSFIRSLYKMPLSSHQPLISKEQILRSLNNALEHPDVLSPRKDSAGKTAAFYVENAIHSLHSQGHLNQREFQSFKGKVRTKINSYRQARRKQHRGERRRRQSARVQTSRRLSVEQHQRAMEQRKSREVLDRFLANEGEGTGKQVGFEQIKAAGQVGGEQGLQVIEQALGSDRRLLRVAAVAALQEVGSQEAKQVLQQIVEEEGGDVFIKAEAEKALGNLK